MTRSIRVGIIVLWVACAGVLPSPVHATDLRRSGLDFMGPQTRAMQLDDTLNPGMLWVAEGESHWKVAPGASNKSCAGCHGDASRSMRGVAARYPAFSPSLARPVTLAQRINLCRQAHQMARPWAHESQELLALEAYVGHQSRGMELMPGGDPRLVPFRERGLDLFRRRMGQLDLSCAQCHDGLAGGRLGGSAIPQAHPTGYPLYRLEWQGLGSLQRRLRNCMSGVRAEPFPPDASEWVELELYLTWRARGMTLETPAVRP
jgi:sulfur-oxidizing protein SoxA